MQPAKVTNPSPVVSRSRNDLPRYLEEALAEQAVFGPSGQRVPLHSNVSLEEARILYRLVREIKPSHSLEIGFAQGISAVAILQALSDNEKGCHHVLDPFQDRFENVGLAMVERGGFAHRFDFHQKFAEESIPNLPQLQFAFIDSSHLFDITLTEFVLADKKLDIGGLMVFHDMWMPSLQKFVRYILNNRSYQIAPGPGAKPSTSTTPRQRLRQGAARLLQAIPGSHRIFREELLQPWSTLSSSNMLVLRKTASDSRDWQFHSQF